MNATREVGAQISFLTLKMELVIHMHLVVYNNQAIDKITTRRWKSISRPSFSGKAMGAKILRKYMAGLKYFIINQKKNATMHALISHGAQTFSIQNLEENALEPLQVAKKLQTKNITTMNH